MSGCEYPFATVSCTRFACESVGPVDPRNLFVRDEYGWTVLFAAAEQGRQEEVSRIIFSLAGTGVAPQRLALIAIEDNDGLTAADVAERGGHRAIAALLRGEQALMEFLRVAGWWRSQRRTDPRGLHVRQQIRLTPPSRVAGGPPLAFPWAFGVGWSGPRTRRLTAAIAATRITGDR